jgi:hypothetical protein
MRSLDWCIYLHDMWSSDLCTLYERNLLMANLTEHVLHDEAANKQVMCK